MSDTNAEPGARSAVTEKDAASAAQADVEQRDASAVIEALNAENTQLKDRVLRTLAEMENLRRRTEKEVADAKAYGVTSFARDMLTFADNLARALHNVPAEARESADAALKSFVEGIELTERDFLSRLSRHGVR